MKPILETERLILREYTEDDAPEFFELNSDPEVMRYVPDKAMESVAQAREILLNHPIADYAKYGFGRWACELKSSGEHVGFCGLKFLPELDEVDLGFRFIPSQWGNGLATESSQAVVRYGFAQLRLNQIIGLAYPDNHASIRVLEKAGMNFADVVRPYSRPMLRYTIRRPESVG